MYTVFLTFALEMTLFEQNFFRIFSLAHLAFIKESKWGKLLFERLDIEMDSLLSGLSCGLSLQFAAFFCLNDLWSRTKKQT